MATAFPEHTRPEDLPRKKHGCFFYGCITLLVLLTLLILGISGALFFGMRYVNRLIDLYSENQPRPLPVVTLPDDQIAALQQRIDAFTKAISNREPGAELRLSSDEINGLIGSDPRLAELRGRVHVSLSEQELRAEVSVPLDHFEKPGRYFNGSVVLDISRSAGRLQAHIRELEAAGNKVPESIMSQLRKEDILGKLITDPRTRELVQDLDDIDVEGNTLILTGRSDRRPEPANNPEPESPSIDAV